TGSAEKETTSFIVALSEEYGTTTVAYMINSTVLGGTAGLGEEKKGGLAAQFAPFGGQAAKGEPDAYDDALAGTIMTCTAGDVSQSRYILAGNLSSSGGDVSQSRYILAGNTKYTAVFVENAFSVSTSVPPHSNQRSILDRTPCSVPFVENAFSVSISACTISYKHTVGKYTGHTIMMENGLEYVMKQGGGPFYSVSDGSGTKVLSSLLDDKKYTVYSQLILTAARGTTIAKGET
ncbi:hypothetical protein T484DRAFT_1796923, partial [Baffinella frigidus]